jgi:hypothetical protein
MRPCETGLDRGFENPRVSTELKGGQNDRDPLACEVPMSKTIGQFDFDLVKMQKGDSMPFNPHVTIVLKHWGATDSGGAPVVSANLMTDAEIDWQIAAMKEDIDAVGRRAKAALHKARDAPLAIVASR